MNHKEKLKLARKNITSFEVVHGVSIFSSEFWKKRQQTIKDRVTDDIKLVKGKNEKL